MAGWTPIAPWKLVLGTGQNVTIGAASTAATTAFGSQTRACYVYASSNCHVRIGQGTPTAVATDTFIVGGASGVVLGCNPGDKIAVIQDTAGGTLNVTDLTH